MPSISLKRSQIYTLRSQIHTIDRQIQGSSQKAETERDLSATACVALWDLDVKRLTRCLRRLTLLREDWRGVYDYARSLFQS